MHKMGAPLVNNPPQIQPAAPLTILGTPAPANYEAQIIRHAVDQPNLRQNASDLCDVRQISECFFRNFPNDLCGDLLTNEIQTGGLYLVAHGPGALFGKDIQLIATHCDPIIASSIGAILISMVWILQS